MMNASNSSLDMGQFEPNPYPIQLKTHSQPHSQVQSCINCGQGWRKTPLSDTISRYCLLEHKSVVMEVLAVRDQEEQGSDFLYDTMSQPPYQSLNCQQIDYFLEDSIQEHQFRNDEANQFRYFLSVRKDWKNMFVEFVEFLDWRYHLEFAFLYYQSVKLIVPIICPNSRMSPQQIRGLLSSYLQEHWDHLEQRLTYLKSGQCKELVGTIMLSCMLGLYGIFVNEFCNRKSQSYLLLLTTIKRTEKQEQKSKCLLNRRIKSKFAMGTSNVINSILKSNE